MDYKRACLISENYSAVRWDITTKSRQNPYPNKTTITVKKDEKYKSGYKVMQRNKVDGKHHGDEVRTSRRFDQPEKYQDWKPSKHSKSLRLIMLITEKLCNEIENQQLLKDDELKKLITDDELKKRIPQIILYQCEKLLKGSSED